MEGIFSLAYFSFLFSSLLMLTNFQIFQILISKFKKFVSWVFLAKLASGLIIFENATSSSSKTPPYRSTCFIKQDKEIKCTRSPTSLLAKVFLFFLPNFSPISLLLCIETVKVTSLIQSWTNIHS